ncbi:hypothetical protein CI109_101811 [Kwoniella shandongensis]|uniref:Uncharacterized protein n=1 Tax=Kwoniella shandongensis TaxID=1734106 RepID=A0A5M6C538_9TREE|nr:uncharacterized protein CI109_001067 [Kwoniella shandongensis]KAA5530267.1 hypothetical protein CI109_001067 [Kwoniella shandongensis]
MIADLHTPIFQLNPLPFASHEVEEAGKLEEVQPLFVLPILDEHISATERLLGSLRGVSTYDALKDVPPTPSKATGRQEELLLTLRETHEARSEQDQNQLEDGQSIWARAVEEEPIAGPSRPRAFKPLQTWDRDDADRLDPFESTPFLSERSAFTFDALLTTSEPPIYLPKLGKTSSPTPVHDSKDLLELMIRATLGTVTTDSLKWDGRKSRFGWSQGGGRPLGVERVTAAFAVENFLSIGTAIRRLEIIVDTQSVLSLTPTHHALLHALSTYLTFIKQRLTTAVKESVSEDGASWNKWMSVTKDVRQLAETLCDVMGWSLDGSIAQALPSRAAFLLTHLYSHLLASLSTCSPSQQRGAVPLALSFLLSRASTPFLSLLHQWVGLIPSTQQDEDQDPTSQPWIDLGITRNALSDDRWEYTFSSRKMPGFVPKEMRRTLFEAGRSLRLLREASGGLHPLCAGDWGMEAQWVWGEGAMRSSNDMRSHVRRVRKEVEYWRRSVTDRTRPLSGSTSFGRLRASAKKERKRIPLELMQTTTSSLGNQALVGQGGDEKLPASSELDRLWNLFDQAPGSHLDSAASDKTPQLWASTPLDELHAFIARHSDPSHPLLPHDSPSLQIFISNHLLAPLISHSTLVSTSLVSLYLDDLQFLDHLDILHSFWLGGDVGFVERVSGALFGKDGAGAGEALGLGRRARTRARLGLGGGEEYQTPAGGDGGEWGIGLGLGLSERSRWPPGGAELAYALRTTLLDDEVAREKGRGPVWESVEDKVSFAIRDLPQDEESGRRARWLNPQAIEALDFLYLSYSPPPAISILLPPALMDKYQSVHNLLLRLCRVNVVLRLMYFDVIHQSDSFDEPIKTGVDSGLNRPSSRASSGTRTRVQRSRGEQPRTRTTISLFPKDSKIERRARILRFKMSHLVDAMMRYVIDNAIETKWELMRKRLEKLRRRVPGDTMVEGDSRPSSPLPADDEGIIMTESNEQNDEEEEGEESQPTSIHQLRSIHSLVLYHHLTLDKILRSCLLSPRPGYQVTFKILMTLLGLVLDLGKTLKEVERGTIGWMQGGERVESIDKEWDEKEKVFLHALERLSLRTTSIKSDARAEGEVNGNETEQDMAVLLGRGENGGEDGHGESRGPSGAGIGAGVNDLQELLLRLRFGTGGGSEGKGGRWRTNDKLI